VWEHIFDVYVPKSTTEITLNLPPHRASIRRPGNAQLGHQLMPFTHPKSWSESYPNRHHFLL